MCSLLAVRKIMCSIFCKETTYKIWY